MEITGGGNWLTVSPMSGGAGTHTVAIALLPNEAAQSRTATVKITCGSAKAVISVTQNGIGGGNNAKLVSKIIMIPASERTRDDREITFIFDYDSQNRVSKIGGNYSNLNVTYYADSVTMDGTLTVTAETDAPISEEPTRIERTVACHFAAPLNSSGYISSIKAFLEYDNRIEEIIPITYKNGFLDSYKMPYEYSTSDGGYGTEYETVRYTWTNENIAQIKTTEDRGDYFRTWKYEYGFNYLNKSNIDLSMFAGGGNSIEVIMYSFLGLTGKKCKNLPVKTTHEYGNGTDTDTNNAPENLTYTFDTDGYALSIASSDNYSMADSTSKYI